MHDLSISLYTLLLTEGIVKTIWLEGQYVLAGLLACTPFFYLLYKHKRKKVKNDAKISEILANTEVHDVVTEAVEQKDEHQDDIHSLIVPDHIIQQIISKLDQFERELLFTKKNISLPYLATYCKTNTKYLSIVINTEKHKDFYNYINELRVSYLMELLISNPYYRRLKVSALATKAGFSSPSKLAHNFKKEAGISPSEFIKSLDN